MRNLEIRPSQKRWYLAKRNFENLEDCLALSTFYQLTAYQDLISMAASTGTNPIVRILSHTGASPKLVNRLFLAPNRRF